jgi:hypothetical protein
MYSASASWMCAESASMILHRSFVAEVQMILPRKPSFTSLGILPL